MLASLWTLISDVLAFCGAHPWLVAIACCAYALYWHSSRVDLHQDAMFGIRKVRPLGLHERFMTEITDKFNIIRDTRANLLTLVCAVRFAPDVARACSLRRRAGVGAFHSAAGASRSGAASAAVPGPALGHPPRRALGALSSILHSWRGCGLILAHPDWLCVN